MGGEPLDLGPQDVGGVLEGKKGEFGVVEGGTLV